MHEVVTVSLLKSVMERTWLNTGELLREITFRAPGKLVVAAHIALMEIDKPTGDLAMLFEAAKPMRQWRG